MIAPLALVGIWAFAEALIFFVVADVPISFIAVRYGLKASIRAALCAMLMAAVGGTALLIWARADTESARNIILSLPAISNEMFDKVQADFARDGYWSMFIGSFSGVPYKLYAYTASAALPGGHIGFFFASMAARIPRFICVSLLVSLISKLLARWFSTRTRLIVLVAFWVGFYAWYFSVMPN